MTEWNCFLCKEFQSGTACTFCDDGSEFRKMSNADKIRSMTDEELARLFDSDLGSITINFHCEECNNRLNCDVCYLEWLQSEVE